MSNDVSLIVVRRDAMAGEGPNVDKDKSDKAGTTNWRTEETTEPEELILPEAPPTKPG
jgi:hypothetical protein